MTDAQTLAGGHASHASVRDLGRKKQIGFAVFGSEHQGGQRKGWLVVGFTGGLPPPGPATLLI